MSTINILYPKNDTIVYDNSLLFRYEIKNNLKKNYLKYIVLNLDGVETKIDWNSKTQRLALQSGGEHTLSGYLEDNSGKKIDETDFTITFISIGEKYEIKNPAWLTIASKLPQFIRDDYKTFTMFVEAYYEWLHKSNNPLYGVYNSEEFSDIDNSPEIFLEHFRTHYLNDFPQNILELKDRLNLKNVIKNIKQYYSSKGSEKSFKFLFRLLYNTYVEIDYPRRFLFKPSNNIWVENKFIKIRGITDLSPDKIKNSVIYQYNSTNTTVVASARILDVMVKQIENEIIYELKIDNIVGRFGIYSGAESLTRYNQNSFIGEEAYVDIINNNEVIKQKVYLIDNITTITVTNLGLNNGDNIILKPINGATGNSFLALVSKVNSVGIAQEIRIVNTGYDYRGSSQNFEIYVRRGETETLLTGTASVGKVFFEPGYHETTTSEPSGNNVLQDNRKYQELSYVLKTGLQEEQFIDIVKRLVHPAGFALYTEPYVEKTDFLDVTPKKARANLYYKPLIGNYIAYQINSSVNLRKTGVNGKNDLFPTGFDPLASKPNQSNPSGYFIHDTSTNGPIDNGVEFLKFGFLPNVPDIGNRNDYWVVYPNLSHIIGSFKQVKDLKIKEVMEILASQLNL